MTPSWDIGKAAEGTVQKAQKAGTFGIQHPGFLGGIAALTALFSLAILTGPLGLLGGLVACTGGGVLGYVLAHHYPMRHLRPKASATFEVVPPGKFLGDDVEGAD